MGVPPALAPASIETLANLVVVVTFAFIAILAPLVACGFGRSRGRA